MLMPISGSPESRTEILTDYKDIISGKDNHMTKTHLVQVVVGGRVLTMSGSDDELHMQRVAACVNRKLQELEETESYRALPADLKPVLVELNLADDLIQTRESMEMLESDLHLKENDLAEVKQVLVETQMKLENLEIEQNRRAQEEELHKRENEDLRKELEEERKRREDAETALKALEEKVQREAELSRKEHSAGSPKQPRDHRKGHRTETEKAESTVQEAPGGTGAASGKRG